MLSVVKLATPRDALTVVVPEMVAPGVPVPGRMESVTALAKSVAVCPLASSAVTVTLAIGTPATTFAGPAVNVSDVAGPCGLVPLSPWQVHTTLASNRMPRDTNGRTNRVITEILTGTCLGFERREGSFRAVCCVD